MIEHRLISKHDALRVIRPDNGPWTWPETASAMVSNCYEVLGGRSGQVFDNGDPLSLAIALNMTESLYKCGYAIVKVSRKRKAKK